jgi:hypothetical protein
MKAIHTRIRRMEQRLVPAEDINSQLVADLFESDGAVVAKRREAFEESRCDRCRRRMANGYRLQRQCKCDASRRIGRNLSLAPQQVLSLSLNRDDEFLVIPPQKWWETLPRVMKSAVVQPVRTGHYQGPAHCRPAVR